MKKIILKREYLLSLFCSFALAIVLTFFSLFNRRAQHFFHFNPRARLGGWSSGVVQLGQENFTLVFALQHCCILGGDHPVNPQV